MKNNLINQKKVKVSGSFLAQIKQKALVIILCLLFSWLLGTIILVQQKDTGKKIQPTVTTKNKKKIPPKPESNAGFQALTDSIGFDINDLPIPPDLGGAVGPHHIVTATNTQLIIQDKTIRESIPTLSL